MNALKIAQAWSLLGLMLRNFAWTQDRSDYFRPEASEHRERLRAARSRLAKRLEGINA